MERIIVPSSSGLIGSEGSKIFHERRFYIIGIGNNIRKVELVVSSELRNPHYFVFSDERYWCRENLSFSWSVSNIGHEYARFKFQYYIRLMTMCKHFIIPNNSFAWWAVWLNATKNKILNAPKKWFGNSIWDSLNLTPEEWTKI